MDTNTKLMFLDFILKILHFDRVILAIVIRDPQQ